MIRFQINTHSFRYRTNYSTNIIIRYIFVSRIQCFFFIICFNPLLLCLILSSLILRHHNYVCESCWFDCHISFVWEYVWHYHFIGYINGINDLVCVCYDINISILTSKITGLQTLCRLCLPSWFAAFIQILFLFVLHIFIFFHVVFVAFVVVQITNRNGFAFFFSWLCVCVWVFTFPHFTQAKSHKE